MVVAAQLWAFLTSGPCMQSLDGLREVSVLAESITDLRQHDGKCVRVEGHLTAQGLSLIHI